MPFHTRIGATRDHIQPSGPRELQYLRLHTFGRRSVVAPRTVDELASTFRSRSGGGVVSVNYEAVGVQCALKGWIRSRSHSTYALPKWLFLVLPSTLSRGKSGTFRYTRGATKEVVAPENDTQALPKRVAQRGIRSTGQLETFICSEEKRRILPENSSSVAQLLERIESSLFYVPTFEAMDQYPTYTRTWKRGTIAMLYRDGVVCRSEAQGVDEWAYQLAVFRVRRADKNNKNRRLVELQREDLVARLSDLDKVRQGPVRGGWGVEAAVLVTGETERVSLGVPIHVANVGGEEKGWANDVNKRESRRGGNRRERESMSEVRLNVSSKRLSTSGWAKRTKEGILGNERGYGREKEGGSRDCRNSRSPSNAQPNSNFYSHSNPSSTEAQPRRANERAERKQGNEMERKEREMKNQNDNRSAKASTKRRRERVSKTGKLTRTWRRQTKTKTKWNGIGGTEKARRSSKKETKMTPPGERRRRNLVEGRRRGKG
ncbi:hypothetical protein FA13DRAFT_1710022 [Coprinellus micaceus]|uniref:Uncharacterized protein n=1 Tax=Coprinellus micaceus TaxID=71717 RepID=A0A4Y7TAJ4_COPMI|nr:hypothetical protein FA13DRAFT_1710022 [Coprinellus micaceus]